MKKTLLFLFISLGGWSLAQEANHHHDEEETIDVIQQEYAISFGESVKAGISGEEISSVTWRISPTNGVSATSGKGMSTDDIIFNTPGTYRITFNVPAHNKLPAKTVESIVTVDNARMTFDLKNVQFSQPLTSGDSDIQLSVPVQVELYKGETLAYDMRTIQTTGDTRLTVSLNPESKRLKKGLNVLTFTVNGSAQAGHTQFRVYDQINRPYFFNLNLK